MNRRERIERGLVAVGVAVLVLGLIVGLDSWAMLVATVVVGVAAIAVGGFSLFAGRRDE